MRDSSPPTRAMRGVLFAIAGLSLGVWPLAEAADTMPMDHSAHVHSDRAEHAATDPVAGGHEHPMAAAPQAVLRTEDRFDIPNVPMQRHDGRKVTFLEEIDDGRPVLVDFIFTTCTAICPILSRTFEQVQAELATAGPVPHLVSISIDPENDTVSGPLPAYAGKFRAGPGWQFYTGTVENSIALQKAFKTYRGDKMNHIPVVFLRAKPGAPWVRLEGFASADRIVAEYRALLATP